MPLTRLSLTNFRSYSDALITPGAGLVILTGENGAGKTNVLEAVSLLSPGRGLRGASLSEMARNDGPGGFAVAARLVSPSPQRGEDEQVRHAPGMAVDVGGTSTAAHGEGERAGGERRLSEARPQASNTLTQPFGATKARLGDEPAPNPLRERASELDIGTGTTASAPERRQVRINGASASATSLAEWLSVLWLTPAMDRLFQEGASGRRRFLDRLVLALSPAHAVHASRYEAAMRARNKLLGEEKPDQDWLSALEAHMAEHGAAISQARADSLKALSGRLAEAPEGPFARPALALEGGGEDMADLSRSRARDAAAGRTLIGPHRTDLVVTHVGKQQPASLCSTGEQKALLLSIVLAHADLVSDRSGRRPILLLDEVAAHLDPSRRAALFERLAAGGGQVWMTGTESTLFDAVRGSASWFEVAEGQVQSR